MMAFSGNLGDCSLSITKAVSCLVMILSNTLKMNWDCPVVAVALLHYY
jgi:hypothetical protein